MSTQFSKLVSKLRQNYATRQTHDLKFRIKQLSGLQRMLLHHENLLIEACQRDLNKPPHETILCEILLVKNDIKMFKQNLNKWAAPRHVYRNLASIFDSAYIQPEPYGLALIISAWNYPIFLGLRPLIGAIAAGNCAILKPSEVSPNVAKVLQDLLPRYIDSNFYEVVQGGPEETQQLLSERFDKIFYTGSPQIGCLVYQAAAKHLTPVTLELGGKSPAYFADDAVRSLDVLIQRYLFGKLVNLGQTCIAPDYVMCSERMQKILIDRLPIAIQKEFGSDLKNSNRLCRIVNERHTNRIKSLIDASRDKITFGGEVSVSERWVQPTVFANCKPDEPIMQQEIFGPLIPIMVVESEDDAIDYINRNEKPLALYVFSDNSKIQKKFIERTSSGSCVINETVLYMSVENLPFGGVGSSGMGSYNGEQSFLTFSHEKSVLNHSKNIIIRLMEGTLKYGEMTKTKLFLLSQLLQYRYYYIPSLSGFFTFVGGLVAGVALHFTKDRFIK